MAFIEPCFGIGHNLSLICQMTSEDIKHQLIIITVVFPRVFRRCYNYRLLCYCLLVAVDAGYDSRLLLDVRLYSAVIFLVFFYLYFLCNLWMSNCQFLQSLVTSDYCCVRLSLLQTVGLSLCRTIATPDSDYRYARLSDYRYVGLSDYGYAELWDYRLSNFTGYQ